MQVRTAEVNHNFTKLKSAKVVRTKWKEGMTTDGLVAMVGGGDDNKQRRGT